MQLGAHVKGVLEVQVEVHVPFVIGRQLANIIVIPLQDQNFGTQVKLYGLSLKLIILSWSIYAILNPPNRGSPLVVPSDSDSDEVRPKKQLSL